MLVAVIIAVLGVIGGALYAVVGRSSSNSAQSVASALVADLQSGRFTQVCTLASPGQASKCQSDLRQLPSAHVTYDVRLGAVTTSGNRALAVITGRVCQGPRHCVSNNDANAATDSGRTFDQLYAAAASSSSSSSPFVLPLVDQGARWYVTGF